MMKKHARFPSFLPRSPCALLALAGGLLLGLKGVQGAGLLTSPGASESALALQDHAVNIVIEGGYARTQWRQTFRNHTDGDLEAIYAVPLPEESTLAEVRLLQGDTRLEGEVVAKDEADRIYGEEKAAGNDAGKAEQDGFKRYRFSIARVPARAEVSLEVVYYQPLGVEAGVGTYRYPLEEGGTDDGGAFWHRHDRLDGNFQIEAEVRAGAPLRALRTPGFDGKVTRLDGSTQQFAWQGQIDQLDQDFVLYYQLEENLPGRVEVYAHKPSPEAAGTFLAVITPGLDLKPLQGSDYVFVLDTSGSMEGKFGTLVQGVRAGLKTFSDADRFRIVVFNNEATEWTRGWITATPDNVGRVLAELDQLRPGGGTDLYAGVELGLQKLDADRACSYILVTDAVANRGSTDPRAFRKLLRRYDVRFFAFLLGNAGNQPLIDLMCEATGGYSRKISNQQDIIGEILLAQSKVAYQSLHDARFSFSGPGIPYDVTGQTPRKIFRGQQIVVMGRYREGGELAIELDARLTGEDKHYATSIVLPDTEPSRPELERLWALRQLREWKDPLQASCLRAGELEAARLDLALEYQLVTEDTSMLLLDDARFAAHGIERRNARRTATEARARQQLPAAARTDRAHPMTSGSTGSYGGGALHPFAVVLMTLGLGFVYIRRNK